MFGTDVTVLSRVNRVVEDTRGARADNYLTGSARSPTTRPCSAHHAAASRAISPAAAGSTAGGTAALLIAASPVVADWLAVGSANQEDHGVWQLVEGVTAITI